MTLLAGSGVNVTADRRWLNGTKSAMPGPQTDDIDRFIDARGLLEDGALPVNETGFAAATGGASFYVPVGHVQHGEQHHSTMTFAHYYLLEDSTPVTSSYRACPATGCPLPAPQPAAEEDDVEDEDTCVPSVGSWSDANLWTNNEGKVPEDGDDVVIPACWLVYLDVSSARLETLTIAGTLQFLVDRDLQLLARYIEVTELGALLVGQGDDRPHGTGRSATITVHSGNGQVPQRTLLNRGRVEMRGTPPVPAGPVRVWGSAAPGTTRIVIEGDLGTGWVPGAQIVVSSSTFDSR